MSDVSILTFLKHSSLDKWFCCSLTIIGPSLGEYLLSWCPWEIVFRGAEQTNSKRNRSATVFFPKQVRLNWGLCLKLFVCLTTCWHYSACWTNNVLQPFRAAAGSEHSSSRMDGCVSAAYTGADGKHLVWVWGRQAKCLEKAQRIKILETENYLFTINLSSHFHSTLHYYIGWFRLTCTLH